MLGALRLTATVAAVVVIGAVLYGQAAPLLTKPCEEPLQYSIASFDARFGITEAALTKAFQDAETVWEEAAGRDLFTFVPEGGIAVSLIYSEVQKTSELGAAISEEQSDYDAKKAELESLKASFDAAKATYDAAADIFEELSAEYQEQVKYWNERGGAPPEEYERLNRLREDLQRRQETLNEHADRVNEASRFINSGVAELNAFARKLNAKVDVYNKNAGDDFDQGDYQEDADGKRIHVYEFDDGADLRRVLAHEFGHALGIGHVENPSSVMYSYNAGTEVVLTEEDVAALRTACRLD